MTNDNDNTLAGFWAIFAEDTETAKEVVRMFADYAPSLLEEIESSLVEQNTETALLKLHRLKGTIAYLGFSKITALLKVIEENIKELGLPEGADMFQQLKQKIVSLNHLLTAEVLTT